MLSTVAVRPMRPIAPPVHPETAADLQALHDRLVTAGLSVWLVRHQWGVAVAIASSDPDAAKADAELMGVLADLRSDGFDWAEAAPGIVRVGRSSDTSRWVEVEHWNIGAHSVTCARANALTRDQFDVTDVEPVTMELFGRQWHTLAGMFDAHADDVGHDIDVVFSWVDGTDPAFLFSRTAWLDRARPGVGDDADARTRQIDELRYALRSVDQNAPWVRRIFIATDTRLPGWLMAGHPKITVVRASEHFSDPAALPTLTRTRWKASCTTSTDWPSISCTATTICSLAARWRRRCFSLRPGSAGSSNRPSGSAAGQSALAAAVTKTPPATTAACWPSGSGT